MCVRVFVLLLCGYLVRVSGCGGLVSVCVSVGDVCRSRIGISRSVVSMKGVASTRQCWAQNSPMSHWFVYVRRSANKIASDDVHGALAR